MFLVKYLALFILLQNILREVWADWFCQDNLRQKIPLGRAFAALTFVLASKRIAGA